MVIYYRYRQAQQMQPSTKSGIVLIHSVEEILVFDRPVPSSNQFLLAK